jgi:O-antigen ligase
MDFPGIAVSVGLGLAAGLATVIALPLGLALGVAALIVALFSTSPSLLERVGTGALVAGAMVLAYGFANLGLQLGPVPIPLTEMLLLPLAVAALADRRFRLPTRVLKPLLFFLGFVALRLAVDFPTYGSFAVRDATTAVEALTLLVGYRAVARYGIEPWIRVIRLTSYAVFVYATLFPWRATLTGISPTVGLQRDVPMFGSFQGVEPAVAACTLFFAVYSRGIRRAALVAWGLALLGLLQFRGVYILLPFVFLALGWALRRPLKVLFVALASLVIGAAILSALAGAGIEGRVGPLSSNFFEEHVVTVFGESGPHAGSIRDRVDWAKKTFEYVERSPRYVIFGVGLGPDLTFGFLKNNKVLVRKPHDDYLEIFARTGVIGFAVWLWLLATALRPVIRTARGPRSPNGTFCAWIFAASLIYLGISATQPLLAFPYGTVPLFFLLGMGIAAGRATQPAPTPWDRAGSAFQRPIAWSYRLSSS